MTEEFYPSQKNYIDKLNAMFTNLSSKVGMDSTIGVLPVGENAPPGPTSSLAQALSNVIKIAQNAENQVPKRVQFSGGNLTQLHSGYYLSIGSGATVNIPQGLDNGSLTFQCFFEAAGQTQLTFDSSVAVKDQLGTLKVSPVTIQGILWGIHQTSTDSFVLFGG